MRISTCTHNDHHAVANWFFNNWACLSSAWAESLLSAEHIAFGNPELKAVLDAEIKHRITTGKLDLSNVMRMLKERVATLESSRIWNLFSKMVLDIVAGIEQNPLIDTNEAS